MATEAEEENAADVAEASGHESDEEAGTTEDVEEIAASSEEEDKDDETSQEIDNTAEAGKDREELEEEHVCLLVLCSTKKVKHAPSRVCLHTQAFNEGERGKRERVSACARTRPQPVRL